MTADALFLFKDHGMTAQEILDNIGEAINLWDYVVYRMDNSVIEDIQSHTDVENGLGDRLLDSINVLKALWQIEE